MAPHPDGSVYIRLHDQLFNFDRQGKFIQQIDLLRLGVDQDSVSAFAFFSNGDLLLRRHTTEHSIGDNLDNFFRLPNLESHLSPDAQLGLFRCHLASFSCKAFTQPALNLDDAFALSIDQETDRVFITDTPRHKVYLYSDSGAALDEKTGLLFPNQVTYSAQKLVIADTNHHQLLTLAVNAAKFGEITAKLDTRQGPAKKQGEIWPSAFLSVNNSKWVINSGKGMQNGGIYVFDAQGQFQKRLQLPEQADPFELLKLHQQVWVSDYTQHKIYQLDLEGNYLGIVDAAAIQPLLNKLQNNYRHYQQLEKYFASSFIVALIIGFALALYQQFKLAASHKPATPDVLHPLDLSNPQIHWLTPSKMRQWSKILTSLAMVMLLGTLILKSNTIPVALIFCLIMYLVFLSQYLNLVTRKTGITEAFLIIKPLWGKPQIFPRETLRYSDQMLTNGQNFLTFSGMQLLYSGEALQQQFYPFVRQGTYISKAEMQALWLKNKNTVYFLALLACAAVAYFIYQVINNR